MILEVVIPQAQKNLYIRAAPKCTVKDISERISGILSVDPSCIQMIHIKDSEVLSEDIPLSNQGIRSGERILLCMNLL